MTTLYKDWAPTQFDHAGAFLDDRQDWIVAPLLRTRDTADPLEISNWRSTLKSLGGESETVEVHRFGHWGPGWFEIILVAPDSAAALELARIESALADYPVLDDEDHSAAELEAQDEAWRDWVEREWRDALSKVHRLDTWDAEADWFALWCVAAVEANVYWHTDSSGVGVRREDLERAAEYVDRAALLAAGCVEDDEEGDGA